MNEARLTTIEEIEQFLSASTSIEFSAAGDDGERYGHIARVLTRTQVIQVGWVDPAAPKAKELRPATLIEGDRWREYLRAVQPDRIVQINVHEGSERARMADCAQAGIGVSGSAGVIAHSSGTDG